MYANTLSQFSDKMYLCTVNIFVEIGAIQVLRNAVSGADVRLPGKKHHLGVRCNVIRVARGCVGVKYPGRKCYVTLEWPHILENFFLTLVAMYMPLRNTFSYPHPFVSDPDCMCNRPAGTDYTEEPGRVWSGRGTREQPTDGCAVGLRRSSRRLLCHQGQVQANHARSSGRRLTVIRLLIIFYYSQFSHILSSYFNNNTNNCI